MKSMTYYWRRQDAAISTSRTFTKLHLLNSDGLCFQGLFDTDGCIEDKDRFHLTYSTTSEKLRDDICEVIYSLGMSCSWWLSRKAGVRTAKADQYTINVNIDNDMKKHFFRYPFKLDRAMLADAAGNKRKHYDRIAIKDIVKKKKKQKWYALRLIMMNTCPLWKLYCNS